MYGRVHAIDFSPDCSRAVVAARPVSTVGAPGGGLGAVGARDAASAAQTAARLCAIPAGPLAVSH